MKKDPTEADLLDMLVAELNAKSFCILRNHQVGRALALASDLDPVFAATPFCEGNFYGRRTKRFGRLLKRSPHVAPLVLDPLILAAVARILGSSEELRVGKECVSTCRYRWSPYH